MNGQEKLIRIGDWVLEIGNVIFVLSNEEYQLLQSEKQLKEIKDRIDDEVKKYQHHVRVGIIKPQTEQANELGQAIGNAVRSVIAKEKRQGGLLSSKQPRTTEMEVKWDNPKDEQP